MNFGIIGTNFVTDSLMEAGKHSTSFKVGAIYSRTLERATEFAQKHEAFYGMPKLFSSLDELACCDDIDAVYIASPNALHCEQAIKMLNAGKHVLCEKPMASNLNELIQMFDCAKKNNRVLLEAMRISFTPQMAALKEQITKIGTIRRAKLSFCQFSSRYHRFLSGEQVNTFDPKYSNSALTDLGVYCISMMVSLFGIPMEITATDVKLNNDFNALGTIVAGFGGMLCDISYSKISADATKNEVQGEDGNVVFDRITKTNEIKRFDRKSNETHDISVASLPHDMTYELDAFCEMAEGKRDAEYYNNCSKIVMKIMDEIRRQCNIVFPADI